MIGTTAYAQEPHLLITQRQEWAHENGLNEARRGSSDKEVSSIAHLSIALIPGDSIA
jgi:hypothetical protein